MQILINGILQGILFGAVALAFALVYRTTKVFHIALGGCLAIAPYLYMTFTEWGVPVFLAALLSVIFVALIGVSIEEVNHWPLSRKRAPTEVHFIASLGVYLVLVQCIALVWGNETRVLRGGLGWTWTWFEVTVSESQIGGPIITFAAFLALLTWLRSANRGIELRALADDSVLVGLMGRNVRTLRRFVFGLSAALVAIVGLTQAWDVGFDPHVGLNAVLLGMVGMIIGGTGNFAGAFLGGVLLGLIRAEVVWFGSARWENAVTFALLGVFLFFRPQGIFARKSRMEEST